MKFILEIPCHELENIGELRALLVDCAQRLVNAPDRNDTAIHADGIHLFWNGKHIATAVIE